MITLGRYKICFLDLITDDKTGKLSSSKIWNHICNGILCSAVLNAHEITWELITALGAIVGGSNVAVLFLKYKYRNANDAAQQS